MVIRLNSLRATASLLALAGALGIAAPAVAQDDAAQDSTADSNEIVVTAQFRDQKLQDVPIAITAMTTISSSAARPISPTSAASRPT